MNVASRRLILALMPIWLMMVMGPCPSSARAQGTATRPALDLYAVGDWGIDSPDRKIVADAMANTVAAEPGKTPAAVLLLGDNFYIKLKNIDDPKWSEFFEKTYDPARLTMPFYAALGNHDYSNKDDQIELDYSKRGNTRFHLPARYYRLDLPQDHPLATILMLDSDQQALSKDDWDAETRWIESELAKPHAQWLICAAHHDMFGNGSHGDNGVLQTTWGPLFKRAHVAFYLCGHEHTIQHLEIPEWPISFVIAGGGGAARKPMLKDKRGPFSKAALGFADFHLEANSAMVSLRDQTGAVAHCFVRDPDGAVHILFNTATDPATEHPLQVISGNDGSATQPAKNPKNDD